MSFLGLHPGLASKLGGVVGFTFAFQTAFAAYSVPKKTDRFYDLAGSLGFISTTLVSLYYPAFRSLFTSGPRVPFQPLNFAAHHPRQLLVSALYLLWAGRLGSFLFQRVLKHGKDSRFDDLKTDPKKFSGMWFGQALWVTVVAMPAILINILPANQAALGIKDFIGLGIWAAGFGLEITADRQKSAWRADKDAKKHDEQFISSGVWAWSRHPNYLGEIVLQAGPPLLALAAVPHPARTLALLSPVFSYALLRYASGVPPLEQSAEKKWGGDEKWRKYTKEVSMLFPLPGGLGKGKLE